MRMNCSSSAEAGPLAAAWAVKAAGSTAAQAAPATIRRRVVRIDPFPEAHPACFFIPRISPVEWDLSALRAKHIPSGQSYQSVGRPVVAEWMKVGLDKVSPARCP